GWPTSSPRGRAPPPIQSRRTERELSADVACFTLVKPIGKTSAVHLRTEHPDVRFQDLDRDVAPGVRFRRRRDDLVRDPDLAGDFLRPERVVSRVEREDRTGHGLDRRRRLAGTWRSAETRSTLRGRRRRIP